MRFLFSILLFAMSVLAQTTPATSSPSHPVRGDQDNARKAKAIVDQMIQALGGQAYLSIQDITQGTALMIVMGGTFGAVLITTPLPIVLRAFKGLSAVFLERTDSTSAAIETLVQFATKARKNGIVSLETEAAAVTDPFLRKALNLAVDGTDFKNSAR